MTTKGYALQASEVGDGYFSRVDNRYPKFEFFTNTLADATLFPTVAAAVQRAFDLGYYSGSRYGDARDRANDTQKFHRTPAYRILRVFEVDDPLGAEFTVCFGGKYWPQRTPIFNLGIKLLTYTKNKDNAAWYLSAEAALQAAAMLLSDSTILLRLLDEPIDIIRRSATRLTFEAL